MEQFRSEETMTKSDYISTIMDFRVPFPTQLPTRKEKESNSVFNGSKIEQGDREYTVTYR